MDLQLNLSIADMLYNGYLVIADNFFKAPAESRLKSHRKSSTLWTHLLRTFFIAFKSPREHFGQNLPLNSGHPVIGWEKRKHMHALFDTFLYFNMKLII